MSATSSYVNEIDEITTVMQAYIDGARTGKGAAMKPAFHDDATIFGYVGPDLFSGAIQGLYDWNDQNGPAPGIQRRDGLRREPANTGDRDSNGLGRSALDDPQVCSWKRVADLMVSIAIGLIAAWGLSGLVRGFLFEVQPHDPRVYAGALLVLATTGLAAAFGPARRASSVDPLIAIRME